MEGSACTFGSGLTCGWVRDTLPPTGRNGMRPLGLQLARQGLAAIRRKIPASPNAMRSTRPWKLYGTRRTRGSGLPSTKVRRYSRSRTPTSAERW